MRLLLATCAQNAMDTFNCSRADCCAKSDLFFIHPGDSQSMRPNMPTPVHGEDVV